MSELGDFRLEALRLEPGDTILLRPPLDASIDMAQRAAAELRNRYPEHVVLIVQAGWFLDAVGPLGETARAIDHAIAAGALVLSRAELGLLDRLAGFLRAGVEAHAREAGT
jgi:hypothetical protein